MNEELFNEASKSNILSKQLVDQLQESMTYSSISFINWTIEVLKLLKARIERGDKIKDETTGVIYDLYTFRQFVETNFSTYITGQVFNTSIGSQKVYFTLEACPGGYNLLMADSGNEKTYRWISSLSKRFSLVEMIATGIVYVKDNRTDTYQHLSPKTANTANTTKTWENSQSSDQNGESATADSPFFSSIQRSAETHSPLQATGNLSLSSQPSSAAPMAHPTPVIPQGISAFPPSRPAQR